jgi:hypothetical protein
LLNEQGLLEVQLLSPPSPVSSLLSPSVTLIL